jgi:hypothetical protein
MQFKMRAECVDDIMAFRKRMAGRIEKLTVTWPSGHLPDCEAVFFCSNPISVVKNLLHCMPDGHVMLETIAPFHEYTGDRKSEGHGLKIGPSVMGEETI